MTNLNAPAKSRGVVLFAFNTKLVDYVSIAQQSARLIKCTLDLPVTIISDIGKMTDNYRTGYAHGTQWYNSDRYRAYEFSPYDETLLFAAPVDLMTVNYDNTLGNPDEYYIFSIAANTNNFSCDLQVDYEFLVLETDVITFTN